MVRRQQVLTTGREPTPEELAQHTHTPSKTIQRILEAARPPLSLETLVGEDSALGEFLEDPSARSAEEALLDALATRGRGRHLRALIGN